MPSHQQPDEFDRSFDELIAKGYLEETGIGEDGEPKYRMTAKACDLLGGLDAVSAMSKLFNNIAKRN